MDVGRITSAKSAHLNDTSILYHSVRNPGFVYMFNLKRGKEYRCCRCKELGKERTITVINDSVSTRRDMAVLQRDNAAVLVVHESFGRRLTFFFAVDRLTVRCLKVSDLTFEYVSTCVFRSSVCFQPFVICARNVVKHCNCPHLMHSALCKALLLTMEAYSFIK